MSSDKKLTLSVSSHFFTKLTSIHHGSLCEKDCNDEELHGCLQTLGVTDLEILSVKS